MPEAEKAEMPPTSSLHKVIQFGQFVVTPQVFHITPHSFCLVNLKPLLPGHVLVSPLRRVVHVAELTPPELTDLFLTVQKVEKTLKRLYSATAFNIAIQDGAAAGQSVPHVHAHVIPRRDQDMDAQGGGDKLYELLEGPEGDVGRHLSEEVRKKHEGEQEGKGEGDKGEGEGEEKKKKYNRFPKQRDEDRKPRDMETMKKEAEWLAREMKRDEEGGEGAATSTL